MSARDKETGVLLKARMDWVAPKRTLDLKTFSATRGKSIDKCVTDAIFYECYYRQAYFYSLIRSMQEGGSGNAQTAPEFVMVFVESDRPYEVRIRSLLPKCAGNVNLYWERARVECRSLIRVYADYSERFGAKPWRLEQDVEPLMDEEMPQLAWN
jgi:hypothetical protein